MIIAIPTYNRSDVLERKTLKTLIDGHVNPKNIYIFVANDEERKKYEEAIPKEKYAKIVVGEKGIANQRIFITKYFKVGEYIVSIDDDVEGLFKKTNDEPAKLKKITNVNQFFLDAYEKLKREKLFIWGIYPVRNPFFMKNNISTGLKFIIGALHGYINRKLPELRPSIKAEGKEDYEQGILYFKKDGGVIRYNNITINTKFKAKGGLGEEKDRFEINKKAAEYLQKQYPDLVTIFHRKNGMTEIRLANKPSLDQKALSKTKSKAKSKTKFGQTRKRK